MPRGFSNARGFGRPRLARARALADPDLDRRPKWWREYLETGNIDVVPMEYRELVDLEGWAPAPEKPSPKVFGVLSLPTPSGSSPAAPIKRGRGRPPKPASDVIRRTKTKTPRPPSRPGYRSRKGQGNTAG